MSRIKMDDIIFGRSLREPGYRVDFAVGSTYSLDLDTFISLPFALGFLEEPDEVMKKSVAYVFSALRLCSDRLAVFCNFSDIKVPVESRKVYYALMEGSVFPINAGGKKSQLVNFHPKVWVVRQTGLHGEGSIIRVVVMSRNLTREGDLDCACVLTGAVGERPVSQAKQARHAPLRDFLRYLARKATPSKRHSIESLSDDLLRVDHFDYDENLYEDYAFLPMGIPSYSGIGELEDMQKARRVVVVSPFIDKGALGGFAPIKEKLLVTQSRSVTQDAVEAFGKENIYTENPQMEDNDLDEKVRLHAKMYFTTIYRKELQGQRNYLYLGSTNATMGGFDRNVEFLVRFQYKPYMTCWEHFAAYFTEDPEKRFSPAVCIDEPENESLEEYRRSLAFRRAVAALRGAAVDEVGEKYAVTLHVDGFEGEAMVYPLMRPDLKATLAPELVFTGMSLIELTEFYVLEMEDLRCVVKVRTEGIPPVRNEEICRSVISSEAQFMDCISFLLSDSKAAYIIGKEVEKALSGEGASDEAVAVSYPAVYENLLREAYESPDTFEDIRTFVESLPADVVPEDFGMLYNKVLRAVKSFRR